MHGLEAKDGDRVIDWSEAAEDYAKHRPGFPDSFYSRLKKFGIGLPGQRVLDLATGTGTVARALTKAGCDVVGVDIAEGQIEQATSLARADGLQAEFNVCPAEETGLADGSFDIITAAQCWLYFDRERILAEVSRLLAPGGRLVTCHLSWLSRIDPVAKATEALILKHNPDWSANDWDGTVPVYPLWYDKQLKLEGMFYYDEEIPFTHESWRGRIRASRGISATLDTEVVSRFDREHEELLQKLVPESFGVLHRVDAHIFSVPANMVDK